MSKKIISMDVFDTAIIRTVYKPTDLFGLISNEFKSKRIEAETKARQNKTCYNIDDIYAYLPEYDKMVEIELELENCRPNPTFLRMYDKNKVIFISDMYLPSEIIKQMLIKCGYEDPKVFVSCELGEHKGNGGLFKKVPYKIECHYGDNYIADILGARIAGINSKYHTSLENMPTSIPDIENSKLKKLLVENEYSNKCLNSKAAFYFAPMVYNFTKWILDNRQEGQNIFFCARDGYLPYIIAKDIFKAKDIYYINASRKSVLNASMDFNIPIQDNKIQFERMLIQRIGSIEGFLKSIGYYKKDLQLVGNIKEFIINNQDKLYTHFKVQEKNAKKYFDKFDIKDNDMLVDVGYYGTIQYAIERIIGKKLKGYYLQTFDSPDINIERYSYFKRKVVKYCFLIESFLSSTEDGVNGYTPNGDPIFYNDNESKKEFSKNIINEIFIACKTYDLGASLEDIEKLVIRFLYYPTLEESNYCNNPIFENGDIQNFESVVWYDKDAIKSGYLQDCYNKSYWKPAFMQLLKNDKELSSLERLVSE